MRARAAAGVLTACAALAGCSGPVQSGAGPSTRVDVVRLEIAHDQLVSSPSSGTFRAGDSIDLEVTSDAAHEIHVHGYDLMIDVRPGTRSSRTFTATIPGAFEVEIEDSHTVVFRFDVI